jgi:hypothetical protein
MTFHHSANVISGIRRRKNAKRMMQATTRTHIC